jgi:4,5:9,10-diseco-3-hydroxy-5,9,17-trioxoandrosta-1(10),2-diene-4-oate hydrolase
VSAWNHQIPALVDAGLRVLAIDTPGFGRSEAAPDHWAEQEVADHLAAFLDTLYVDSSAVVGHSLGGAYATILTLYHPHRVTRLVLAAPAIGTHLHPGLRLLSLPFVKPFFRAELARPILRQVLSLTVHNTDRITDADVDEIGEWLRDPVMRSTFLRILTTGVGLQGIKPEMLLADRLDVIDQPVLLLWGRHDRILSIRNARDILKQIPQAQYIVLENSGHQLTYEEPALFNRLLIDFLKS